MCVCTAEHNTHAHQQPLTLRVALLLGHQLQRPLARRDGGERLVERLAAQQACACVWREGCVCVLGGGRCAQQQSAVDTQATQQPAQQPSDERLALLSRVQYRISQVARGRVAQALELRS